MSSQLALYSAVGPQLTHYRVDISNASLSRMATVDVPSRVQYAWRSPLKPILYVTTASSGPRQPSTVNHVSAWSIGADGSLKALGEPCPLPARAVHMCVDPSGQYVINAFNFPRRVVTVHRIQADGSVGPRIEQANDLDYGIYPHQVRFFPSGKAVLIVDRGNNAKGDGGEEPGALRSFAFDNGVLSAGQVIAPNGGYGFGPRHVDFHPTQPWLFVADERFNSLHVFNYDKDAIDPAPVYTLPALADPATVVPRQMVGPIHVHPNGKFVYVANRSDQTVDFNGTPVFGGGENTIAVYAINEKTGEPTLIQHAETNLFHVRTFSCDPSGQLLVAASIKKLGVRTGDTVQDAPAAMSVFRIVDGKLHYVRQYDAKAENNEMQYWVGIIPV